MCEDVRIRTRLWEDPVFMAAVSRFEHLADDLARLGVTDPVPLRVRVALRRRGHLRLWVVISGALAVVYASVSFSLFYWLSRKYHHDDALNEAISKQPLRIRYVVRTIDFLLTHPFTWGAFLLLFLCLYAAAVDGSPSMVARRHRISPEGVNQLRVTWLIRARRYAIIMEIAQAISACARAHSAGGEQMAHELRRVSRRMGVVTRALRNAHNQRGTVPRWSHRRTALKLHERKVISALRKAEMGLDDCPREALEELGRMLLKIADRYCRAQLSSLLDPEQLTDVEQAPNREYLRIIAAAVFAAAAAIVVPIAGVPKGAESIVTSSCIVVACTLLWGRAVRRAFDVIGLILGP